MCVVVVTVLPSVGVKVPHLVRLEHPYRNPLCLQELQRPRYVKYRLNPRAEYRAPSTPQLYKVGGDVHG